MVQAILASRASVMGVFVRKCDFFVARSAENFDFLVWNGRGIGKFWVWDGKFWCRGKFCGTGKPQLWDRRLPICSYIKTRTCMILNTIQAVSGLRGSSYD